MCFLTNPVQLINNLVTIILQTSKHELHIIFKLEYVITLLFGRKKNNISYIFYYKDGNIDKLNDRAVWWPTAKWLKM